MWSRRADTRLPNASTTKMITALVTVRNARLGEPVVVSEYAAATPGGGVALTAGDIYTVKGLLYALLLSSSNDAAVALAEHVAASEARFVARMNHFARALELRNTHFVTPHGLDHPDHWSSAHDLAAIGERLLATPVLADIVATRSVVIVSDDSSTTVHNRNELLGSYRGARGIKTGQTSGAGEVLVAAAERQGRLAIAVAMRSVDASRDARRLLDYGFATAPRPVIEEGFPGDAFRVLVGLLLRWLALNFHGS